MSNGAEQLDTRIEIVTPENIAFQYCVAGPFRRLPAYLIDVVIRILCVVGGFLLFDIVFGSVGMLALGVGMGLILWFALSWFYGGVFETFWNGQTPGKRIMRIRVVSVDGQPINGVQAVLRNFLLIVDSLPMFGFPDLYLPLFQVGLIAAMTNRRFQRLGDMAAGTMVVVEEGYGLRGLAHLGDPEIVQLAAQIPPNFQTNRSLARAISAYVERRGVFSWGRRIEVARYVAEPLREKFNLPPGTNLDLLLCALYYRTFIAEQASEESPQGVSPFAETKDSEEEEILISALPMENATPR
jgi:uncharacterized RDD family membrane protein YckC